MTICKRVIKKHDDVLSYMMDQTIKTGNEIGVAICKDFEMKGFCDGDACGLTQIPMCDSWEDTIGIVHSHPPSSELVVERAQQMFKLTEKETQSLKYPLSVADVETAKKKKLDFICNVHAENRKMVIDCVDELDWDDPELDTVMDRLAYEIGMGRYAGYIKDVNMKKALPLYKKWRAGYLKYGCSEEWE